MRTLFFVGTTLAALRQFPDDVKRRCGYELDKVQNGIEPSDWKPMKSIGPGVREIRVKDDAGQFRIIYVANIGDAIYALHAFQKKTQKTSKNDLEIAKQRLKQIRSKI